MKSPNQLDRRKLLGYRLSSKAAVAAKIGKPSRPSR